MVFTCNKCPVAVAYEDRLMKFAADYKDKGVSVVAINVNRTGHNRLPRYIRGQQGIIEQINGLYPIEDEKVFAETRLRRGVYGQRQG